MQLYMRPEYSKVRDKIKILSTGEFLISKDTTEEEYYWCQRMKRGHIGTPYALIHIDPFIHNAPRGKINTYFIPEDIYDYIRLKNEFVGTENVPKNLRKKLKNCLIIINTDYKQHADACWYSKDFGLHLTKKAFYKLIVIKKSKNLDRISFGEYYPRLAEKKYIKNYDEGEKEKEYWLAHGYRE